MTRQPSQALNELSIDDLRARLAEMPDSDVENELWARVWPEVKRAAEARASGVLPEVDRAEAVDFALDRTREHLERISAYASSSFVGVLCHNARLRIADFARTQRSRDKHLVKGDDPERLMQSAVAPHRNPEQALIDAENERDEEARLVRRAIALKEAQDACIGASRKGPRRMSIVRMKMSDKLTTEQVARRLNDMPIRTVEDNFTKGRDCLMAELTKRLGPGDARRTFRGEA